MHKKKREDRKGRPPNDAVMMFKTLVLRELYQLSDDNMEYQIMDRLSFQRFLGLSLSDDAPDAKSIWHYREGLTQKKVFVKLFDQFNRMLEKNGLIAERGVIVDASFKEVPIQRNSKDENKKIKKGEEVAGWSDNKRCQKDTDARWTKKNKKNYFGYKNHIKVDAKSKLIKTFRVTS